MTTPGTSAHTSARTSAHTSAAIGGRPVLGRLASLRTALLLDAVVTGVNGAAYLAGASLLDELLGLPAGLLRGVGGFLLAYGGIVWFIGTRRPVSRAAAWTVVAANAIWAVDSLAAVALRWGTPTTVGAAWVAAQAGVVGGFALLQMAGLRAGRGAGAA